MSEGRREKENGGHDGLDRRALLGLAGGGALGWAALSACSADGDGRAGGEAAADDPDPGFPWLEADIDSLQRSMAEGELNSEELTRAYLQRIEAIDWSGPTLRSVIETNPHAPAIAAELDRERRSGTVRGPLHGLPILLKDNIATADRTTTTAGSLALEGSIPPEDSAVARLLRAAGAVLLGKANLSEWANIRSNRSSSGWSARGGQCRNP